MAQDFWLGLDPTHASPYWPYRKVEEAATLAGAEDLTYKLVEYLMDYPDGTGYEPVDDNRRPRVRLAKYLYWDGERPLDQPLPTPEQKRSIQFDPERPSDPPDERRGYRVFGQELVGQAQTDAQTILRVYPGPANLLQGKEKQFVVRQQIIFTVMVSYGLEANMKTRAASRSYNIMQCIKEATSGVNFGGVGGMNMINMTHFDDERTNTGFKLYQYIDWMGSAPNPNYA